jgi:hypothetical protein
MSWATMYYVVKKNIIYHDGFNFQKSEEPNDLAIYIRCLKYLQGVIYCLLSWPLQGFKLLHFIGKIDVNPVCCDDYLLILSVLQDFLCSYMLLLDKERYWFFFSLKINKACTVDKFLCNNEVISMQTCMHSAW